MLNTIHVANASMRDMHFSSSLLKSSTEYLWLCAVSIRIEAFMYLPLTSDTSMNKWMEKDRARQWKIYSSDVLFTVKNWWKIFFDTLIVTQWNISFLWTTVNYRLVYATRKDSKDISTRLLSRNLMDRSCWFCSLWRPESFCTVAVLAINRRTAPPSE